MSKPFKQGTVLLVSSQVTQRSGLRKSLLDAGFENKNIEVAGDFEQAKSRLDKGPVNLLITDDYFGSHAGMELLDLHLLNNPVSKERLFIIMMSETSPFMMAEFALKGGDVIISKPFTNETFNQTLAGAVSGKETLSEAERLALDVQDALWRKDLTVAQELAEKFQNAESLHAIFSLALIQEARGEAQLAFENFSKVVRLHADFKSLVRLVRIGNALQKHSELLEFVEIWLKKFPLHHESLQDISRVIIANKKFELLDEIFDLFGKHRVNDAFARVPIAAGFVMASVHHFEGGNFEKTRGYALKAIEYSGRRPAVILKALEMIVKSGFPEEAEAVYQKLVWPTVTPEDKVMDLKMRSIIYPQNMIVVDCFKLLSQKVVDPDLYRITIGCLRFIGKDPGEVLHQARQAFPNLAFD